MLIVVLPYMTSDGAGTQNPQIDCGFPCSTENREGLPVLVLLTIVVSRYNLILEHIFT